MRCVLERRKHRKVENRERGEYRCGCNDKYGKYEAGAKDRNENAPREKTPLPYRLHTREYASIDYRIVEGERRFQNCEEGYGEERHRPAPHVSSNTGDERNDRGEYERSHRGA